MLGASWTPEQTRNGSFDAPVHPRSAWVEAEGPGAIGPGYTPRIVEISELQDTLRRTYADRDARRGPDATFRWLTEEVGELARALRHGRRDELVHEFSDVIAWLASLANLVEVDLDEASARYANGCPKCGASPCTCAFAP